MNNANGVKICPMCGTEIQHDHQQYGDLEHPCCLSCWLTPDEYEQPSWRELWNADFPFYGDRN